MITKDYAKQTDTGRLTSEIIASGKQQYPTAGFRFYGVNVGIVDEEWQTQVMLADDISQAEIAEVDVVVANSVPVPLPQPEQPTDQDDKPYVRAEPRPLNCTTIFVNAGDTLSPPSIGTGTKLTWDASVSGEWSTDGAPSGFKRKIIELIFLDTVYSRGGYVHTKDAIHGSYLDMYVMCPPTGWFLVNGVLTQNNSANYIAIDHNVVQLPLTMCNASINLDSGTASQGMPVYYLIRAVVTIPVADVLSTGNAMLMMYRTRTIVL